MAEKGLNWGINKTPIMTTKITVRDMGDFESVWSNEYCASICRDEVHDVFNVVTERSEFELQIIFLD